MPCCAASDERPPRTNTATRSTADSGTPVRSMLARIPCGCVTIRALAAAASRAEIAAWSSSCWHGPAELGHAGGDLGHLIGAADLGIAGVRPQPVYRPSLDALRGENHVHCGSSLCFEVIRWPGFGQVDLTKWLPQKSRKSKSILSRACPRLKESDWGFPRCLGCGSLCLPIIGGNHGETTVC